MKPYIKAEPPALKQEVLPSPPDSQLIETLKVGENSLSSISSYPSDFSYSLVARVTEDTLVLRLSCSGLSEFYDFPIIKSDFESDYNSDYLFFLASRIVKSLASIYPFIDEPVLIDSFLDLEEDEFLNVSYQISYRLDLYFQYFSTNLFTQKINETAEDRWRNIKSQMHLLNNC